MKRGKWYLKLFECKYLHTKSTYWGSKQSRDLDTKNTFANLKVIFSIRPLLNLNQKIYLYDVMVLSLFDYADCYGAYFD